MPDGVVGLLSGLNTLNQILAAGIAITAFSLLLYALTFNLRDRVARSFAQILICVVIVFVAKAIGGTVSDTPSVGFWLRLQWVGIIFLPPTYLHFSDALLATTGKPSRGRRSWAVRFTYLISVVTLIAFSILPMLGPVVFGDQPAPHLAGTPWTTLFTLYYAGIMILAWVNFARAYRRTLTPTTRRRMIYLLAGATAPALGSYPYLLFGSAVAANFPLLFWTLATLSNLMVGVLVVVMAYAVAFFGVPWPDRVVKARLFKWLLRGPFTASVALALTTLVRRTGVFFGITYSALVPIVMVLSILLLEYMVTLFSPFWERWLFYGKDRKDLTLLKSMEDRLLTRNDLRQFLEMILAAVCDRLQAPAAFVAALNGDGLELVVKTGNDQFISESSMSQELFQVVSENHLLEEKFRWGDYLLVPLHRTNFTEESQLVGLLGVASPEGDRFDEEQMTALALLSERAALALQDRHLQQEIFKSLQSLNPQVELIQRLRAAARYDGSGMLLNEDLLPQGDMAQWVKDALTHYWGGPKLTENPLMKLKIVQDAIESHDGNNANALRAILRRAIEQVKPEGDRRFTGEWILYNILELKFLEGRRVREVALRLAMSEADLYRKQRVAIEAVAKAITEMEEHARQDMAKISE
ncbi:MAG: hypothetical protein M1281_08240 [Chloroflexi bacterium]|nr:hypothetical protein [Chloroflexota bacterium]